MASIAERLRRERMYACDDWAIKSLIRILRRERIESAVLGYINEMRAISGGKPVQGIWPACAFFRDHESRIFRVVASGPTPEATHIWLARQIRAVLMFQTQTAWECKRHRSTCFAWRNALIEEINELEAAVSRAVR